MRGCHDRSEQRDGALTGTAVGEWPVEERRLKKEAPGKRSPRQESTQNFPLFFPDQRSASPRVRSARLPRSECAQSCFPVAWTNLSQIGVDRGGVGGRVIKHFHKITRISLNLDGREMKKL